MRRGLIHPSLPTILCLLVFTFPDTQAAGMGHDQPDGPGHVASLNTLHPRRLWHIGQEDDIPLGHIIDVTTDRDGTAYLLDETMVTVHVVAGDGSILGDIGQEGEGPGEIHVPKRVGPMPGGLLGVSESLPGRIVLLDPDGTPRGLFTLPEEGGGIPRIWQFRTVGDHTVVSHSRATSTSRLTSTVHRIDVFSGGRAFAANLMQTTDQDRSQGMTIDNGRERNTLATCWDVTGDGHVAIAPVFDAYEIRVFDLTGAELFAIRRPYDHVSYGPERLRDLRDQNAALRRHEGDSEDIYPYERDIFLLEGRPNGDIWALSSRGRRDCPAGSIGIFDVYDRKGTFRHDLVLAADYDSERDDFVIDGSRLYVLKEGQMSPATEVFARYGNSMVHSVTRPRKDPEGDDARPYGVICYELE